MPYVISLTIVSSLFPVKVGMIDLARFPSPRDSLPATLLLVRCHLHIYSLGTSMSAGSERKLSSSDNSCSKCRKPLPEDPRDKVQCVLCAGFYHVLCTPLRDAGVTMSAKKKTFNCETCKQVQQEPFYPPFSSTIVLSMFTSLCLKPQRFFFTHNLPRWKVHHRLHCVVYSPY